MFNQTKFSQCVCVLKFSSQMFCSELKARVESQNILGKPEREAFVTTVMKLIDRGQYSKNGALAWTAASSASRLAYIEPSIVLPMVVNRFQMALDTVRCKYIANS